MSSGSQRQDRGRRTGSSWGEGERSDSHQAAVVPAPAAVAQALGIQPGSEVVRRSRVYRDRHGIVAHSTSWIPARYGRLIPQLAMSERLTGGHLTPAHRGGDRASNQPSHRYGFCLPPHLGVRTAPGGGS
ncbi:UTRA domain-containing protein [Streptomyces kutzneri]|uniref:UTRA domain-containing protein n=1 Tax=Streptomyces kutzneri TaxID=3051179 RepID=UPI0034D97F38